LTDLFSGTAQGPAPWDPATLSEGPPSPDADTTPPSNPPGPDRARPEESAGAPARHDASAQNDGVRAEPAPLAVDTTAPVRLPFAGSLEAEQQLATANQATWKLLDEHRRNPDQPSGSRGYRRISDDKASTTDPDATPMRRYPGDVPKLGYHDQYVVD